MNLKYKVLIPVLAGPQVTSSALLAQETNNTEVPTVSLGSQGLVVHTANSNFRFYLDYETTEFRGGARTRGAVTASDEQVLLGRVQASF